MNKPLPILPLALAGVLALGTWRDADFWSSPDERGDIAFRAGDFAKAASQYTDPWRRALAEYRRGNFEAAAKTFARVPGSTGAFNQGDALLMQGQYDRAIAAYDRALGFRPGWKDAEENKALATARRDKIKSAANDATDKPPEEKPDEIVFDQKSTKKGEPQELTPTTMSDSELRASWLRRVQTTPGDFLRAKFAYQASSTPPAPKEKTP